MGKIKNYFSDQTDKIKTSMKIDKAAPFYYISIVLLFFTAILVRSSPLIHGTKLIKAFDPWYQYDSLVKLINMGWYEWLHFHDYKFWYPSGVDRFNLRPGLLVTNAIIYWGLNAIGIQVTPFQVAYHFPAFMGGLTVVVIYFLGKEILDKRAGLVAAFFLTFSPGHMQRTVIGFFDNETIGVFAVLLSFLFFVRAVKYGKLSDGIYGGLSLGYLALSWGGLTYVFLLLPMVVFILILLDKYHPRVLLSYSLIIGIGELIYTLNPSFKWERNLTDMEFMAPILFLVFLIIYHLFYMQKGTKIYDNILTAIKWSIIPLALAFLIIFWVAPEIIPFNLGGRLASIINPNIRESFHLVASVGEHAPSPWSVFYYNSFIPLLFIIPGIYFAVRRGNIEDVLLIVFVVTLFYFTGSMIRIILLFAPALALLGGYAISYILKHFGNLMTKERKVTRRRKRQLNRTISKSEGIIVYVCIGLLLFVQANHAIDISAEQMPYADLVSLDTFHDWEESLTWMKQNLPGTAVVVSWWDYGYWMTTLGNVTTVNDNGTWNQTRIGMTGMAMMQTNERHSAEIFRALKADYVMVYFGHLYGGIGGDEGKWPWMLRICNDNTAKYKNMGMEKDNWYGEGDTVDTVFNEAEYVNETTGQYYEKWFQSTLVKLMFADEIISSTQLQENSPFPMKYLAQEIEGVESQNKAPRKDADGNLWSSYDSINGNYELEYFSPMYYSMSHLVKVFKVDYSALDSSFDITNSHIEENGIGFAEILNTGTLDLDVSSVNLNYKSQNYALNYTLQNSDVSIQPNKSRYIWFDINNYTSAEISATDTYNLEIGCTSTGQRGDTITIKENTVDKQISLNEDSEVRIDRSHSTMELDGTITNANISLINSGNQPVKINKISINGVNFGSEDFESLLISPQTTETFYIENTGTPFSNNYDRDVNIKISTFDGANAETSLAFNQKGFDLSIVSKDLEILPEDIYLYNYTDYEDIETPEGKFYLNYDEDSYLLEDGTLQLTIQNTGQEEFGFETIYADDTMYNDFEILNGQDGFLDVGDSITVRTTIDDVVRNTPVKIFVTAMNEETCASDALYIVPHNQSQMISIISDDNSMTSLFTDENLKLVVKNTGIQSINLDSLVLTGTDTTIIDIDEDMVDSGSITLAVDEVVLLECSFTGLKVNISDIVDVKISASSVFDTVSLTARLPTLNNILEFYNEGQEDSNINLPPRVLINGDPDIRLLLSIENTMNTTIDGLYVKLEAGDFEFIPLDIITLFDNDANEINGNYIEGATEESGSLEYYFIEIQEISEITANIWVSGDEVTFRLVTEDGYEITISYIVI